MKYIHLVIVFFIIIKPPCSANTPPTAQEELSAILNELYQATGFFSLEKPKIKLSEYTNIAEYNIETNTILISHKVLTLCSELSIKKEDALSILISHELAHHFLEKGGSFIGNKYSSRKDIEKQADIQGIFMAHLAGYNAIEAAPIILDKIYTHFDIPQHNDKYPHFKERIQFKNEVIKNVTQLINIFEAGNFLTALGKYDLATACYQYITNEHFYFGKELHNNLGVVSTLHAMNVFEEDIDYYLFPLELDENLRIEKPKRPRDGKDTDYEKRRIRNQYLQLAQQSFETAFKLDPQYSTSIINSICVNTLQNKLAKSEALAQQHKALFENNSLLSEKFQLVMGIVYAKKDNAYQAIESWKPLTKSSNPSINYQASYNLEVLTNDYFQTTTSFTCNNSSGFSDIPTDINFYNLPTKLFNRIEVQLKQRHNNTYFCFFDKKNQIKNSLSIISTSPSTPSFKKMTNTPTTRQDILYTQYGHFLTCKNKGFSLRFNSEGILEKQARLY